jgi:hypothetical protein
MNWKRYESKKVGVKFEELSQHVPVEKPQKTSLRIADSRTEI